MRRPARALVIAAVAVAAIATVGACRGDRHAPKDAEAEEVGGDDPAEQAGRRDSKCVAGDLEACRQLGVMYSEGTGVSRDPRRGVGLFDKACSGGNMIACNNLAHSYVDGIGIEPSGSRAVGAFQKACDGGYKLACRNLGLLLRDGRGIPADLPRAEALLDKACKGNVPFACTNAGDLDAMLAPKQGMVRAKQALAHYKQGCDNGDPTACRQIGIAYLEGKGVTKSSGAAAVWLERACLPDDPLACRMLGLMLVQGTGVTRDPDRGKQLLSRACDARDEEACRQLAAANAPPNDAGPLSAAGDASAGSGSGPSLLQ